MKTSSTIRPTIIVGKSGTGKTHQAKEMLGPNHIMRYANEYDIYDNFSIPLDRGILIEEVHFKAKTKDIIQTILEYRGTIVLTSINQKDVPKKLFDMCKLKRAGTLNFHTHRLEFTPNANMEEDTRDVNAFEVFHKYMKSKDRDKIAELLKSAKPPDVQILTWLATNVHPNKISYVDAKVKRRWSSDYFYELLAYAHDGARTQIKIPKRRKYDTRPSICRKLGLRPNEYYLIGLLNNNDEFKAWAKKKLNRIDQLAVGISSPTKRNISKYIPKKLGDF